MQKTMEFTMPGIKGKMTGVYEGRSKNAVIIGVDTAIGYALAHSMRRAGFDVIGFGEMKKSPCGWLKEYHLTDYTSYDGIPEECNRLLFCHDAALQTERHAPALDALCRKLAENRMEKHSKQITVSLFTPANACECKDRLITEDAGLLPRSRRDLAYAHAELMMHAWYVLAKTNIRPVFFRYGELYADMPEELPLAGHVMACLKKVRRNERLVSPGIGNLRRTLTHLEDFANMVAVAIKQDFMPSVTNIAGEAMSVLEYMIPLEDRADKEMYMDIGHYDDDYPDGIGDRVLYSPQFQPGRKYYLGYRPCHKYKEWAASLPGKAPKLKGFDITKA